MPKQPTVESPALVAERERCAAEQRKLDAFDRHTADLHDEIEKFRSVLTQMGAAHDAQTKAAAEALEHGEYVSAPVWDEALHKRLLDSVKDRELALTRSLYSNFRDRDAERRALQQSANDAARALEAMEARHSNARALEDDRATCAALLALASRMKPADAAEFEGFKVERKRDQVVFTVMTLAAAGNKKGQAA